MPPLTLVYAWCGSNPKKKVNSLIHRIHVLKVYMRLMSTLRSVVSRGSHTEGRYMRGTRKSMRFRPVQTRTEPAADFSDTQTQSTSLPSLTTLSLPPSGNLPY